jgi:ABC-type glycerol-3-phosphate transport system substrate-binding protein
VIAGTVTIWHAWDERELPALAIIIKAFQQEFPDVYFDVTYVAEQDLLARYQDETLEGRGPGILLAPATWVDELDQAGLTADLAEWADESLLNTLNEAALAASRREDRIVSLPYSLEGVVLYRNKDVATLKADSLQELVSLAQTSTQDQVIGAFLERSFYYSGAHLSGLGGSMIDENGLPAFNSSDGLTWIEMLKMFESAGPTSFQSDDDLLAFKEGKVGWIIDGTWNLTSIIESLGIEKIAIDPWLTYGPGRMSGYIQSENIYLSNKIQESQKLAAWKFIEFLLSPTAQAHLGDIGRIPSASGANLTNPVNGPLITQAMTALANGVPYPNSPHLPIYEVEINMTLQSIFQGSSPLAALQVAQAAIQEELQIAQASATPTP